MNDIIRASIGDLRLSTILENNWKERPIVDVRAIRQDAFRGDPLWLRECPIDHPIEVMYDIWQGTRGMCDCLEREGDR